MAVCRFFQSMANRGRVVVNDTGVPPPFVWEMTIKEKTCSVFCRIFYKACRFRERKKVLSDINDTIYIIITVR